jgi:hypothetical protein
MSALIKETMGPGVVVHTYNPSYSGGRDQGTKGDPISKISNTKRAGGVAQVVEHLSTERQTLSSNSSAANKKKNKKENTARCGGTHL